MGLRMISKLQNFGYPPELTLGMVPFAPSEGEKVAPGKAQLTPLLPAPSVRKDCPSASVWWPQLLTRPLAKTSTFSVRGS